MPYPVRLPSTQDHVLTLTHRKYTTLVTLCVVFLKRRVIQPPRTSG